MSRTYLDLATMSREDIIKNLDSGRVVVSQSDYLAQIERIDGRSRERRMEVLTWVATIAAIVALIVSVYTALRPPAA